MDGQSRLHGALQRLADGLLLIVLHGSGPDMGYEGARPLPGPQQALVLQILIDAADRYDTALQVTCEFADGRKQRPFCNRT